MQRVNYNNLINFVNQTSVREMLGVGNHSFNLCDQTVEDKLANDEMQSVKHLFGPILLKIKILIFNGNFDFTVPVSTTNAWIDTIKWEGEEQFTSAKRTVWVDEKGSTIGYYRGYQNLQQVVVVKAGHVVCQDQPKVSHLMINNFIYNLPWKSS